MVRWSGMAVAVLATTWMACGSGSRGGPGPGPEQVPDPGNGTNDPPPAVDPTPPPAVDPTPCAGGVTLRLQGVDPGAISAMDLVVADVAASAAGAPLALGSAASNVTLDLFVPDHAHRLATILSPPASGAIDVSVSLAAAHATLAGASSAALDVCTPPLAFRIDRAQVSDQRCHAVVLLDLARSVVPTGEGALSLLPQFRLAF